MILVGIVGDVVTVETNPVTRNDRVSRPGSIQGDAAIVRSTRDDILLRGVAHPIAVGPDPHPVNETVDSVITVADNVNTCSVAANPNRVTRDNNGVA